MKCEYCQGDMTIEDEVCQYCGRPNPHYVKHREEMQKFKRKYESTDREVKENAKKLAGFSVKMTVVAVLCAVIFLEILLMANSYNILRAIERHKITSNLGYYVSEMNRLEEEGDLSRLSDFYSENSLYFVPELKEYRAVQQMGSEYGLIMRYVVELAFDEDIEPTTRERDIENLSDSLRAVYKILNRESYYEDECFKEKHQVAMDNCMDDINALLKCYLNIDDEALEALPTMSDARRQLVIEEGLEK